MSGLRNLLSNAMFHLAMLITVVFLVLEVTFGDVVVRIGAVSMRLAVFAVLSWVTMRSAWRSILARSWSPPEVVSIAVCALSTMIALHAAWIPLSKYFPLPDWYPKTETTTALIIGVALAGIGYLVPISQYRYRAAAPAVASWASVFTAGFLAGSVLALFLATGMDWRS